VCLWHAEVRRRVDEYFRSTGRRQWDCPRMYLKTAIILACCAACYILLVFVASTWWLSLAIALGLSLAAFLPVAAVRLHDDQVAAFRRLLPSAGWSDRTGALPAPAGMGTGHLPGRQAGVLRPRFRDSDAASPGVVGAAVVRPGLVRARHRVGRRVPAGPLRRGGGVPASSAAGRAARRREHRLSFSRFDPEKRLRFRTCAKSVHSVSGRLSWGPSR
jgi:hypothetical protein